MECPSGPQMSSDGERCDRPERCLCQCRAYSGGRRLPAAMGRRGGDVPRWRALGNSALRAGRTGVDRPVPARAGPPRGLVVFVHGGYWRAFGPRDWSHLAAGGLARGWAVAMPGYTLAPEARISDITIQIQRAVTEVAKLFPGPLVLAGHSAGGHLVARMGDLGMSLPPISRIVPISPLADLRPLMQTDMNRDLRLDEAEARQESPVFQPHNPTVDVRVWVGGDERPVFLEQAKLLAKHWNLPAGRGPGPAPFRCHRSIGRP
jgi:arylformamidase